MIPFIKINNEKLTLLIGLIIAGILFFTTGASATGNNDSVSGNKASHEETAEAETAAYEIALMELEEYLSLEEEVTFDIQNTVQIYDGNLNLIQEVTFNEGEEITDENFNKMIRQASLMLETPNSWIYLLEQ